MNQRETFPAATTPDLRTLLRIASPATAGFISVLIAYLFQDKLFADLTNYPLTVLLFYLAVRDHDVVRLRRDASC